MWISHRSNIAAHRLDIKAYRVRQTIDRNILKPSLLSCTLLAAACLSITAQGDSLEEYILNGSSSSAYRVLIQDSQNRQAGSTSIIRQHGSGNDALVNQGYLGTGPGNLAVIGQVGNFNEAAIIQRGAGNTGLMLQKGNDLSSQIIQDGDRFDARVQQSGHNANLQLSQSGSGLRAIQVRQWAPSGAGARVTVDTR